MGPFSFILLYISTVSAAQAAGSGGGNYSTQLMADLTPRGFTIEQWNATVDTMIGKTQAYVRNFTKSRIPCQCMHA
jgi:hypothetical protein